jgi:alcohol dehydrogenase class IV
MSAEIQIPSIIKMGSSLFAEVPGILKRLHCSRPMIVTDPFLVSQGRAAALKG